ncbi:MULTISPECIES: type II secretion system F family protein [unclassified Corynebacterium]|uniref:type II secretion system F family protein n=1 Tax=unclassified Corynebacterium TaxID=2624378 RepID=UPI0030B0C8E7
MSIFGVSGVDSATVTSCLVLGAGAVVAWPERSPRVRLPELWHLTRETSGASALVAVAKWLAIPAVLCVIWAGVAVSTAAVLVGWTALTLYREQGEIRRKAEHDAALERALDGVVAELRAGARVQSALRESGAMSHELAASAAWRLAQHHGLPLADILDRAKDDVAARRAHFARTSAALAGPRMTMLILAALPVFGLILGQAFGAEPLRFLLGNAGSSGLAGMGNIVLVTGVFLTCAGLLWSHRILSTAEGTP